MKLMGELRRIHSTLEEGSEMVNLKVGSINYLIISSFSLRVRRNKQILGCVLANFKSFSRSINEKISNKFHETHLLGIVSLFGYLRTRDRKKIFCTDNFLP